VACGYSQVLDLNFNGIFAQIVNDVTVRILLISMLIWNLKSKIVDLENACLFGYSKDEIFMEIPEGSLTFNWFLVTRLK
jgi:hypothetical protein